MKALGLNEIREVYLSFFESKKHLRLNSFSVIPQNDKSLLLINSGMAPLKPYFTGQETPPSKRVTTCQKCIRTGDIENVGKTARHGTFFEMLGNFSFGDYFKEEVIPWAWEFVTEVLELPQDRLYVSVYEEDDEAYQIWHEKIGLPHERIFRMGKDDNFWEVGLGPCGPCSEIYYDKGEEYGCGSPTCTVGCDCDRYMEFWNLVFTQFNKEEDGTYSKLQHPNIDTGMGLERMATIMQNVNSIFDIDTLKAIRDRVCALAKVTYNESHVKDISIRVITDHIRSVTFMTADGVLPSNEGRGYVLRRLLRRAIRHGRLLGIQGPFLLGLCQVVIDVSKDAYPELVEKQEYIFKIISVEEERFYETLDQGMELLKNIIQDAKSKIRNVIIGEDAFKLYDTYGFPVELMKEILEEQDMQIDEEGFQKAMNAQKERARSAREESTYMGAADTVYSQLDPAVHSSFLGYDTLSLSDCTIVALIKGDDIVHTVMAGDDVSIVLDQTCLYAESGGQKGDCGQITGPDGVCDVLDTIKVTGGKIAHLCKVIHGSFEVGQRCTTLVDKEIRLSTARNHTATHLLQKALRDVLGNHVEQAGSFVSSERLRFDFTHFEAISSETLEQIEEIVNNKILEDLPVCISIKNIEEARKMGAMALFGEKYGQEVRVVQIGDYSTELCGGTHLVHTSQIGTFKLLSESGVAAGVRRIEAVTGKGALAYHQKVDRRIKLVSTIFKVSPDNIGKKVENFLTEFRALSQQVAQLKSQLAGNTIDELIGQKIEIHDIPVIIASVDQSDPEALKTLGDKVKDKLPSCAIFFASETDGKVHLVAMASDDVVKKGLHCGNLIKTVAPIVGGSGGGRPNMAQAGGKDPSKIKEALQQAKLCIEQIL